ncbi:unnamed protein product [Bursaphelenchus xylophilus]|uniref:(pine wood nematode) hypothetical protein n=1 Tax=Bursaphelenchus xylophilus TaxID=6326 RepID=A0A1I7RVE3_BURXY|nr:unnamed protein product [Bursaphelenchus xylophilus]CAG9086731.1 unnamed protein product [Bursaphelenchus xylophilus]
MADWRPVRIVAAADLRNYNRTEAIDETQPTTSNNIPINSQYYNEFINHYNTHAYHGGTLDAPNGFERRNIRYPYRVATTSRGRGTPHPRSQGRFYRSFSGPFKSPAPLYNKRRATRPVSYMPSNPVYVDTFSPRMPVYPPYPEAFVPRPGVFPPFYPPFKYTPTYQSRNVPEYQQKEKYPFVVRVLFKLMQVILAVISIVLIIGPSLDSSLAEFMRRTNTEWQSVVLAILAVLGSVALVLMIVNCCTSKNSIWRKIDVVMCAVGVVLMFIATGLEAYYAACYPPNGPKIALVCYETEWIFAAALCFLDTLVYVADLCFQLRSGVSLL